MPSRRGESLAYIRGLINKKKGILRKTRPGLCSWIHNDIGQEPCFLQQGHSGSHFYWVMAGSGACVHKGENGGE